MATVDAKRLNVAVDILDDYCEVFNNKEYDYQMGVHYMDLIGECEKLGDYVVNVVEARTNVKEKKTNENR